MLVVAPPRVCRSVWPAEVAKWADFNHLRVEVLHGPRKEETLARDADIYCVSYEGLEWLLGVTKQCEVKLGNRWLPYDPADIPAHGKCTVLAWGIVQSASDALEAAADMCVSKPAQNPAQQRQRALLAAAAASLQAGKLRKVIKHDPARLQRLGCDVLVCDEISKLKHADSGRSALAWLMRPHFKRVWGLTGSPAANGLMNLFGIMKIVDGGKSLGPYITHFRRQFFFPDYTGFGWEIQPNAEERIYARIAPYVFRLASADYLKLPELVKNVIYVELPPAARKAYDEVEDEFITELMDGEHVIVAVNSGAAGVKCRQLASGGIYLPQEVDEEGRKEGKRKWLDLHNVKVEATRELVEELNGAPCIVTYDFEHDLARLQKEFGKDTPRIGGGITPKQSDKILADWNAGKIEVLLTHFQAMAHGLNAQEGNAQHIIMHSLTYDFELYDQLISRLRRSGNTSDKIFVHHIVARDTIDEALMKALEQKRGKQDALQDAMRAYTLRRYGRDLKTASKRTAKRLKKA